MLVVVVKIWHCPPAFVNDSFLGIRISRFVAHCRAGTITRIEVRSLQCTIAESVFPRVPYLVVIGIVVFKIIHKKIVCHRKAPDRAYVRSIVGLNLINPPVVSDSPFESLGENIAGSALAAPIYTRLI